MITEKDLEVLYYITPTKYRTMLDGDFDPNAQESLKKEEKLEELIYKSSLNELITIIIKVFKEKYANPMPIWSGIVSYERDTKKENSKRSDIKSLKFDFRYGVKTTFGGDTEYLDNLFLKFSVPFSGLKTNVKTALQGKQFSETNHNSKTIFTVNHSPILRIEITDTTFQVFIDKDSFIDYGQ
jgi:hypothetical protein